MTDRALPEVLNMILAIFSVLFPMLEKRFVRLSISVKTKKGKIAGKTDLKQLKSASAAAGIQLVE
ncbi:MAG: hypothetical protein E7384_07255 [Ruminococcaceae bacterium]|nr:hypothetical protein [Oscillospiraceae bacterium]